MNTIRMHLCAVAFFVLALFHCAYADTTCTWVTNPPIQTSGEDVALAHSSPILDNDCSHYERSFEITHVEVATAAPDLWTDITGSVSNLKNSGTHDGPLPMVINDQVLSYDSGTYSFSAHVMVNVDGNGTAYFFIDAVTLTGTAQALRLTISATGSADRQLVTTVGLGNGTINPGPGQSWQQKLSQVALIAVPNLGWRVQSWSGTDNDATVALTNQVTMDFDKSVSVQFEPQPTPTSSPSPSPSPSPTPGRMLVIGSASGAAGTQVIIAVTASGLSNCTAWGFDLAFDSTKLNFVSPVQKGSADSDWASVSGSLLSAGHLRVGAFAGSGTTITGDDKELCRITFSIKAGASGTVTLTPSNPTDGLSGATLANGHIAILPPVLTPTPSPTPTPTPTPTPSTAALTIGSISGAAGMHVTIQAMASGMNNCTAWGFDLAFDSSKVDYVSVQKGAADSDWALVSGSLLSAGNLRIGAFAGSGTAITGDNKELCQITFSIKAGASGTVALTPSNPTDALNGATLANGQITILPPPTTNTLTIGSVSGAAGTQVTIPVTASVLSSCTAWGFDLTFDSTKLDYVSPVQEGAADSDWAFVSGSLLSAGNLRIGAFAGSGTAITGDNKELCRITFSVKAGASGNVALTPSNPTDALNGATLVNGQITILPPPATNTLTIGSVSGAAGTQVTIPVTANGLSSCTAWGFDLTFNSTKVDYISVQKGAVDSDWALVSGNLLSAGNLRVGAFAGSGTAITGDNKELCRITFSIKAGASGIVTLTPSSPTDGLSGATLVPGQITIDPELISIAGTIHGLAAVSVAGVVVSTLDGLSSGTANSSGDYSLTVPLGWSGTVRPLKNGYAFSPPSRAYLNVTANMISENYSGMISAARLKDHLTGKAPLSPEDLSAADANQDGCLDVSDLRWLIESQR